MTGVGTRRHEILLWLFIAIVGLITDLLADLLDDAVTGDDMAAGFGADRRAAVCRELTKLHEEVVRGPLSDLAEWAETGARGEIVVVVAGAEPRAVAFPDAVTQVLEMVRTGTRLKEAAGEVSTLTGHSSRELYQAALAVKR